MITMRVYLQADYTNSLNHASNYTLRTGVHRCAGFVSVLIDALKSGPTNRLPDDHSSST